MKEDILCISSIDWDFVWQGHQEIMSRYAAQGHRVLFIENTGVRAPRLRDLDRLWRRWQNWRRGVYGVREERDNLFVFSPIIIPLPHSRLASWLNQRVLLWIVHRWMNAVGFTRPIVWTFLPTRLILELLGAMEHSLLIYYCIDRFTASSSGARKIARAEEELLRQADLIFVTSQALGDQCARFASHVYRFPFGVDAGTFQPGQRNGPPADVAHLPRPLIGYVGGLHQWVDQPLLREVATKRPEYSFVLIGPTQTDVQLLKDLPNIHLIGQRSHEELPTYVQAFDVGLIPYRLTEYTRHVFPTKLTEYLALGKPVVATALPEIVLFNQEFGSLVWIGEDAETFSQAVDQALAPSSGEEVTRRHRAAKANSWELRFQQMTALITDVLERKLANRERQWRQTIVSVARTVRHRTVKILWSVALVWLLMFHTPALRWFAGPLRLSQMPRPADAVVVFAGGVGESGQAGQGYEERVQYAVQLYRQQLVPRLIFSSGYSYAFREARIMEALAVSLGVPRDAILLEEEAGNTYQNVLFSARLMRQYGCHSALVISSPYHMRRVALVWRRTSPDLEAIWVPLPYSLFYGTLRTVELRHWKAVIHEYMGILYYWYKGWI